ncbi:lysophospholipid acyltransferase family protein [Amorphus orientalis]|uniref:1-acyl-sn-glycerol-3-phosphate acyltransferase n=1 Tax=Amorphus orientalis TaxID=649198 RepID=A0AAE3VSZ3_9HYPH|nr:lysophospholipid acyltransferase family protein [Amorphus orientalis]MDQ0317031.1 1-acyl-sn-glycerol-3-phosphate acyltransferase [Amorphus orientalis]
MGVIRAVLIIISLTCVTLVLIPAQYFAMWLKSEKVATIPLLWHRITTRLLGIRVLERGAPTPDRPLLVAANHVSWLDITVLGSLMPLSFIAKAEVAGWPVFGLFAKLQRTVFVDRTRRHATGAVAGKIAERLKHGDVMVLFAEGTSSSGTFVLPFRTALLGAAKEAVAEEGERIWVQPLAIAYTRLYGIPLGRYRRPLVAWYGDMDMAPHLWRILKKGPIDVEITWGEAVAFGPGTDRKEIARKAEEIVRRSTVRALTGRADEVAATGG